MAQSFLLEKNMKRRLIHKILLLVIFSAYSLSPLAISFNAQRAVLDSHNRPLPLLFTISLFLDNLISAEEDIQQEASAPCDAVIIKKKQGVLRSAEVVRAPTLIYISVLHLFILAERAGSLHAYRKSRDSLSAALASQEQVIHLPWYKNPLA